MFVLEITESLFERLQKHAVPLVDTPATVIERLLNFWEKENRPKEGSSSPLLEADKKPIEDDSSGDIKEYDPRDPPNLLHTRCQGYFGDQSFEDWNSLLRAAHIAAFKRLNSFEELQRITHAKIKKGNFQDQGYRYLPEAGISIQGVDAIRAWAFSFRLAKSLGIPIGAYFEWRDIQKAAHPGEFGTMDWVPPEKQDLTG